MQSVPKKIFFTKGVGKHKEKLQSLELALRKAGIEICNLVSVSSIFPPNCRIIPKPQGIKLIQPGQIVFCVMSTNSTNEPNRMISASVGLAVPAEPNNYGYLSEHHANGETDEKSGDYAEDLAATMLASTLGIEFDPEKNYDERKEIYRMSGKIVKSRNTTQSAKGDKKGLWSTVVSAAVFLP
jgi:arginine decarboxylase